jgi:hypothetical protein
VTGRLRRQAGVKTLRTEASGHGHQRASRVRARADLRRPPPRQAAVAHPDQLRLRPGRQAQPGPGRIPARQSRLRPTSSSRVGAHSGLPADTASPGSYSPRPPRASRRATRPTAALRPASVQGRSPQPIPDWTSSTQTWPKQPAIPTRLRWPLRSLPSEADMLAGRNNWHSRARRAAFDDKPPPVPLPYKGPSAAAPRSSARAGPARSPCGGGPSASLDNGCPSSVLAAIEASAGSEASGSAEPSKGRNAASHKTALLSRLPGGPGGSRVSHGSVTGRGPIPWASSLAYLTRLACSRPTNAATNCSTSW